jgi:hypothetical protein
LSRNSREHDLEYMAYEEDLLRYQAGRVRH